MQKDFSTVVWLDETQLNDSHTLSKGGTDDTLESTMTVPIGKEGRIIVLHSETSKGLVENCLHVFR